SQLRVRKCRHRGQARLQVCQPLFAAGRGEYAHKDGSQNCGRKSLCEQWLLGYLPDGMARLCPADAHQSGGDDRRLCPAYRDGGWIARWSSPGYADLMVGTSSDIAFADAYIKGVTNFDVKSFYQSAVKNAAAVSSD